MCEKLIKGNKRTVNVSWLAKMTQNWQFILDFAKSASRLFMLLKNKIISCEVARLLYVKNLLKGINDVLM